MESWITHIATLIGVCGFLIAALSYRNQMRIRRAEWLKSLFEKFYENPGYKEVRVWLDYGKIHEHLVVTNEEEKIRNEEKFADFLNFFEFVGVLYARGQLRLGEIVDIFDYYLKKIKSDPDCRAWIDEYGFEKLKAILT